MTNEHLGLAARPAGFQLTLASSVGERDGMALELTRTIGDGLVAEVFEDGESKARKFTMFDGRDIPVEVIEWFLAETLG